MNASAPDKVFVEGLEVFARIGCTDEERGFPQKLLLDIDASVEIDAAVRSDSLADTICYQEIASQAAAFAAAGRWALVERFAHDLLSALMETFPAARSLRLRVRKFAVPGAAAAGVEIVRQR